MPASRAAPLAAFAAIALVAVAAIEAIGGREPTAAGEEADYRLLPAVQGDTPATPARSIAATPAPEPPHSTAATIWSTPAEFAPPE